MDLGQLTTSVKFLIRDRAGQFTDSFDAVLQAEGIRIPDSRQKGSGFSPALRRRQSETSGCILHLIGSIRWWLVFVQVADR